MALIHSSITVWVSARGHQRMTEPILPPALPPARFQKAAGREVAKSSPKDRGKYQFNEKKPCERAVRGS